MDKKLITNLNPTARVGMSSIYRMSDAPPNWAQDDPTQPDYIKNKQEAEKLRPIYVNGKLVLDDTHESGPVNLVEGENVAIIVDGNNVIFNVTNSGSEEPEINIIDYISGEGIVISDVNNNVAIISIDKNYVNEQLILPVFSGLAEVIKDQGDILSILVDEDFGKSIREISSEVSQTEIADWFANNSQEVAILERLEEIDQIIDIEIPLSNYVNQQVDERVAELGGTSAPATSDRLGSVKIDDNTIKMNENNQIYISQVSTDNLVQGSMTLVLNGGNDDL